LVEPILAAELEPWVRRPVVGYAKVLAATALWGINGSFDPVPGVLVAYALLGESLMGDAAGRGAIVLTGIQLAQNCAEREICSR
jgi:hypothetical protein